MSLYIFFQNFCLISIFYYYNIIALLYLIEISEVI